MSGRRITFAEEEDIIQLDDDRWTPSPSSSVDSNCPTTPSPSPTSGIFPTHGGFPQAQHHYQPFVAGGGSTEVQTGWVPSPSPPAAQRNREGASNASHHPRACQAYPSVATWPYTPSPHRSLSLTPSPSPMATLLGPHQLATYPDYYDGVPCAPVYPARPSESYSNSSGSENHNLGSHPIYGASQPPPIIYCLSDLLLLYGNPIRPFYWDLRCPPPCMENPPNDTPSCNWDQSAVQPPVQEMEIVCRHSRWKITVRPSSLRNNRHPERYGSIPPSNVFVSVRDVLEVISENLQTKLTEVERKLIYPSPNELAVMHAVRGQRLRLMNILAAAGAVELSTAQDEDVRRVDTFDHNLLFDGLKGQGEAGRKWEMVAFAQAS